MMMPADHRVLRIGFAGEVDHGKSTLVGRLLLDSGTVPPDRLTAPVEDGGLAFLLDGLTEERADLFTLDTAQAVIETDGRRVVVIDVPGHVELLRNMVTGSAGADAGVMVVDATIGVTEQTHRHARVLRLLGVGTMVCAITKMDLAGHDQGIFDRLATDVRRMAGEVGIRTVAVVPVSAFTGANVVAEPGPGDPLAWYRGASLLNTVRRLPSGRRRTGPLRFAIQTYAGPDLLAGRVESGTLCPGAELIDVAGPARVRVVAIERFGEDPLAEAGPGDSVALRVTGDRPPASTVLAPPFEPMQVGRMWTTRLLGLGREPLTADTDYLLRRVGSTVTARLRDVELGFGEVADAQLHLGAPAAADVVDHCPETARFMLCDVRGEVVGAGVIEHISATPGLVVAGPAS